MKMLKEWKWLEPEEAALWLGLTTGLGLAMHEIFFVIALVIVLVEGAQWLLAHPHRWLDHLHEGHRHA